MDRVITCKYTGRKDTAEILLDAVYPIYFELQGGADGIEDRADYEKEMAKRWLLYALMN